MLKKKVLSCLVFVLLILIVSLPSHSRDFVAIDEESAELDSETTAITKKSLVDNRYILNRLNTRKLVTVKNVRKVPSGPNPIGNQHLPPSIQA